MKERKKENFAKKKQKQNSEKRIPINIFNSSPFIKVMNKEEEVFTHLKYEDIIHDYVSSASYRHKEHNFSFIISPKTRIKTNIKVFTVLNLKNNNNNKRFLYKRQQKTFKVFPKIKIKRSNKRNINRVIFLFLHLLL